MKRLDKDLYSIEYGSNGKKQVHIFGYAYDTEDGSDSPYRMLEFTFLIIPIEEFVMMTKDEVLDRECETKQYMGDYDKAGIVETLDNYFGEPMTELSFKEVTVDTPCGYYIER